MTDYVALAKAKGLRVALYQLEFDTFKSLKGKTLREIGITLNLDPKLVATKMNAMLLRVPRQAAPDRGSIYDAIDTER